MATEIEGLLIKIGADAEEAKRAFADIQSGLDAVAGTFTDAGTLMTAGITAPLLALGAAGLAAGLELDSAFDTIRVKTGATGDALEGLQGSFREVFKGVASSAEDVGKAIADISTRTGQTGPALETLSTQFLNLSRITGEDLGKGIATGTQVLNTWGVEASKQGQTLDMLFRASQNTGIGFSSLSEKLTAARVPLQALGFSLEQSAVMVAKFEKEGLNVSQVLGGMQKALGEFGKAGLAPAEAFKDLIGQIKNADSAHATLIATSVVGSKKAFEFADAIRKGKLDLTELYEAVVKGGDSINKAAEETADFAESWQIFKNKMTLALEPLGGALMNILNTLTPHLEKLAEWVGVAAEAFGKLGPGAQTAIVAFGGVLAAIGPVSFGIGKFVEQIPTLKKGFEAMGLTTEHAAKAIDKTHGVFANLSSMISGFSWSGFIGGLSSVGTAIAAAAVPVTLVVAALGTLAAIGYQIYENWNDIKATLVAVWTDVSVALEGVRVKFMDAIGTPVVEAIKGAWAAVAGFFSGIWDGIVSGLGAIKQWVVDALGLEMVGRITSAWTTVAGFFSGIWDGIVAAARTVGDAVSRALGSNFLSGLTDAWSRWKANMALLLDGLMHPVKSLVNGLLEIAKALNMKESTVALENWKRNLDNAAKAAKDAESAVKDVAKAGVSAGDATKGAAEQTKNLSTQASGAKINFQELGKHAKSAADLIKEAFSKLGFKDLEKEARDMEKAFNLLASAGKLSAQQLEDGANKVRLAWAAARFQMGDLDNFMKNSELMGNSKQFTNLINNTMQWAVQLGVAAGQAFQFEALNKALAAIERQMNKNKLLTDPFVGDLMRMGKEMKELNDTTSKFGVTLESSFVSAANRAGEALDLVIAKEREGLATKRDVAAMNLAALQSEINLARARGEDTAALTAEYNRQKIALDGVGGALKSIGGGSVDIAQRAKDAAQQYEILARNIGIGGVTAVDAQRKNVEALKLAAEAAKAGGKPWVELEQNAIKAEAVLNRMIERNGPGEMEKQWKNFSATVHQSWDSFKDDIATAIIHGEGFSAAFKKIANDIKDAFLNMIVKGAINEVLKGVSGLTEAFTGLGKHVSGVFNTIFGGAGGGGGPQVPVIGGGGGAGAGAALGGVTSGLTGMIGMVGSIGSMISSIIGNFQNARMEKTMNAVEENTRYTKGYTLQSFEYIRDYLPWLKNTAELLRLESIEKALYSMASGANLADAFQSLAQMLSQPLQAIYQSMETFRETTRQQLQFISEATMATYSAINKPGFQAVFNPSGGGTQGPSNPTVPLSQGRTPTQQGQTNIYVTQTTSNPYVMGMQVAQGLNSALPVLR